MKKYIAAYQSVKEKENILFGSIIDVLTDFHANGSYESIAKVFALLDTKNYAYMVRTTDLEKKDYESDVKYITQDCYNYLSKSQLYGGELLINKIGNPGESYIMPKLDYPSSLGMNLFMIRIKKDSDYNTKFIWAYLNTNIGRHIINRKINGTVPLTIDKEAIRSLYIPVFSKQFMTAIAHIIDKSELILSRSKQVYKNSEELIYKALHLDTWEPATEKKSIKSYSDCFINCNRLDAEYYQPKYDELFALLGAYDTKTLSEIVNIEKSIEPGSEAYQTDGIPFIRVANLSKFGIADTDVYLSTEEYGDIIRPEKDTILLSKDGSVGIAYKVEENTNIITSGAILHLTIKDDSVMPDYLTLVLNSIVVKMQAERDAGGSVIQHWKPSEIEKVIIPILDNEEQIQIAEKVQESFALRKECARLLELAKTAVEVAIEQGEDRAMELLTQNM